MNIALWLSGRLPSRPFLLVLLLAAVAPLLGCSDVCTKHVGISFADRYAASGEDVRLVVGTRRSLAGTISSVRVSSPAWGIEDKEVYVRPPEGGGIPSYLTSENKLLPMLYSSLIADSKHPTVDVHIPIPSGVSAAGTDLAVAVSYSVAEWCSPGQFDVNSKTDTLTVPITTVKPGREWLARLADLGIGLAILAGLSTAFSLFARFIEHKHLLDTFLGNTSLLIVGIAWFWASLTWSVWPICATLGWVLPLARLTLALALPACAMCAMMQATGYLARRWQGSSAA